MSRLTHSQRLIEITKCCGYSEIHPVSKDASLADLYETVIRAFDCHQKCELYIRVKDPEMAGINCVCDGSRMLKHVDRSIVDKNSFIQLMGIHRVLPIYPLPASVVYRIYLDDGHRHDDHKCMFDDI